jgi:hypothetical protein
MCGKKMLWGIGLMSGALALAGCYESPEVVVYEPHVYKGGKDPLLERQRLADTREQLIGRFNLVQTDR